MEESVALDDVLSEVLVNGTCLVTRHPASIHELKSLLLHKVLKPLLGVLSLKIPPSLEEPDLRMGEPGLGVLLQVVKDTPEHSVHCSIEVLNCCSLPAGVLVRVGHNVVSSTIRLYQRNWIEARRRTVISRFMRNSHYGNNTKY